MKDNINNEIKIGDSVFCYSGSLKYTIQTVIGFRSTEDDLFHGGVLFKDGFWVKNHNVVSLNALGVNIDTLGADVTTTQCDALGNALHIGDKVLYLHPYEMYAEVGIVKSMAAKSCLLSIEKKQFRQDEYRKKYEELISLTALGIEGIPNRNVFGDVME